MPEKSRILIIRFSAMGDVAMTAPVLEAVSRQYPALGLTMLSRQLFAPFFDSVPGVTFFAFDPKGKHKGFLGLIRLFLELRKLKISQIADLHNNLRSRILSILFFFCGVKTVRLDKARAEKKQLTRKTGKRLHPLSPVTERYAQVFSQLGYPFTLSHQLQKQPPAPADTWLTAIAGQKSGQQWIGVSPFAQHAQKVYPLEKMEKVVLTLASAGYKIFLFGGGEEERSVTERWAKQHQEVISMIGKASLKEELQLISQLDLMVSMDSSGMHMASLKGVPVISIWGATHPYMGFLGYGQSLDDCIQLDLYCRPCSVYGNVPCYRGDLACMNNLPETRVIHTIIDKLRNG